MIRTEAQKRRINAKRRQQYRLRHPVTTERQRKIIEGCAPAERVKRQALKDIKEEQKRLKAEEKIMQMLEYVPPCQYEETVKEKPDYQYRIRLRDRLLTLITRRTELEHRLNKGEWDVTSELNNVRLRIMNIKKEVIEYDPDFLKIFEQLYSEKYEP